eukprot:703865-Amphidinium_carterae.1
MVVASRDDLRPLASRLPNHELVFTDLTTGSYARPVVHKSACWHNNVATQKAHRANGSDAQLFAALLQDFFCVAALPPRAKYKCVAAGYHANLQNTVASLGFNRKAAIINQLIRSPLET